MSLDAGQMTSRERVLAAVRREAVDYVPCSPAFNPLREQQRVGYRYQFPWGPSERERIEYEVTELGTDPVVHCSAGGHEPAAGVSSKAWMEDSVIHKLWTTPAGELHASVNYDDLWPHGLDVPLYSDFNIGHFVEPWLKTEQDLECLRQILHPIESRDLIEQQRFSCNASKRLAERWSLATMASIGKGLTGAQQLAGAEPLCLMTVDNPGLVDAYLELEHQLSLRNLELAADFGVDIINRNGFYETADFYSPAMLERFLGQRLRREIAAAHQAGMLIRYTVHTGVMPILDYLRTLDFDCLFGIDIAFKDANPVVIRDSQEGKKSFWIGPSSTFHLWNKDPEVVRQAVREVFQVFGKRGLILAPCVSAHSIMPWENTLAMIDERKRVRNL